MCTPCVYWLEKTYIFRKQCRKSDTKFRSFLRKVKNKKIHRLDELSDTEDEENGSEDMDLAFVQEYDRKVLDAKVKEQLDVKVKEQLDAKVKEQLDAKMKERAITERKILVSQIKRGLFEALDNLDEEETGTVEVAAVPTSSFLADLQLDVEVEEEIEQEEVEMEEEEVREQVILAPSPPRKKLAPRQANKKKKMSPVKVEVLPSDSEISVVEEEAVDGNIKEEDQEQGDVGETETTAVIMRSGLIHSCRDCNRKFHTAGELVKHSKLHKSSKNNCDDCGKCFSSSGSLFRHQKIHRDEKQHKCDVCGKSFTQKGSLLRHAVVHNENGERPFACDDCDKSFSQRHLLTLHVTKAHSDLAVTYLFRCNECPKVSSELLWPDGHVPTR